jgi:signal peptide peptidase SppA
MFNDILSQQFWMCESHALESFLKDLQTRDIPEALRIEAKAFESNQSTARFKPYKVQNGIAEIPIRGVLLKRTSGLLALLFGIKGMHEIGADIETALNDRDVKGIFLDIDSPGGSVSGTQVLADIVFSARGKKPIMSYADGSMCSAAYWVGSGADQIVLADSTTKVGSVGIVGCHLEYSEQAKQKGIGIHVFSSGKFKKSGNMFEKLSKDDITYIDSQFKYLHDVFIKGVERNLGKRLPSDAREAKTFIGQQAISVGLAHGIMNKNQAMARLKSMAGNSNTKVKNEDIMKFQNYSLKDILMEIQSVTDIDELAKLEQGLVAECQRRKASAKNWVEENEAESLKNSVTALVGQRRRMIQAAPKAEKARSEFALGESIARSIFPGRCN